MAQTGSRSGFCACLQGQRCHPVPQAATAAAPATPGCRCPASPRRCPGRSSAAHQTGARAEQASHCNPLYFV